MAGKGEFKEMEEEEDMGWGKRYMLHASRFGVKGLPPGLQPGERSFGKEKPQDKKRGGCGKGMEGRRIKLEKGGGGGGGEQGDFSILPDFRTCPLFLTISTPGEGNQPISLTKPPSSLPGAAVLPHQWRGTDLPRGAEVKIPAALTFCPSASGRMKNTPFLSPGTLQGTSIPSPWPSSPSLPPLLLIQPFYPHCHTSKPFLLQKEKKNPQTSGRRGKGRKIIH